MNVSELSSYIYNSALTTNMAEAVSATSAVGKVEGVKDSDKGNEAFASVLDQEVSKVSEFTQLAGVLNNTALSSLVSGASEADLAALAEDMLGTGSGREVLSKMIDGHFQSIVLGADDKDNDEQDVYDSMNALTETLAKTQNVLDKLDSAMETLSTAKEENEE